MVRKTKKLANQRFTSFLYQLVLFFAEEEGFEPPEPFSSTVFKTAAFDRSATPLCCELFKTALPIVPDDSGTGRQL